MKVFIGFEGLCESFDILPGQTVKDVKQMIKDFFHIQLSDDKQGRRYLELTYAGGVLRDEWVLADAGITLCSTIKCTVKEEEKPALYVHNAVTQEKVPIMGNVHLLAETVSQLKSLVSVKCGFPVGVFCLKTLEGKEMYDCNTLSDYKLEIGSALRLDVWDGWKELLASCVLGHKQNVQRYLSKNETILRYQQRVALYIAAHFGHLKMADWLQKKGVRADEAIGVHPYREWCCETDHPDISKCAIHAAAEAGQIILIKAFVAHNVLCLDCQTPFGQTPLRTCIHQGHKDCVLYLIMKMWSVVAFPNISLPMNIYVKIKKWLFVTQKKLCKVKRWDPQFKTRVGDPFVVDGFTEPKMTSKSLHNLYQDKWKTIRIYNNCRTQSSQNFANAVLKLHPMTPTPCRFPPITKTAENSAQRRLGVEPESLDIIHNIWKAQISLPPISSISSNRPRNLTMPHATLLLNSSLESFSKHHGRTPRQNAIYFLSLASEFKEKPWLQQLDMARMLAKKMVYQH
ncbi:protein ANKUB1 isoform X1 [Rana temporaria]|uniref:protein ANKUB1 isoform X1 n=1 Tax=Rana temporaria TaxID=8407 RepID=UPI001AACDDE7|nr:protein ANKUB1 isoform X1 [Rana temporaria]